MVPQSWVTHWVHPEVRSYLEEFATVRGPEGHQLGAAHPGDHERCRFGRSPAAGGDEFLPMSGHHCRGL
ncbi:MAG: hypothetical protein ACRDZO_10345 [Egibacteraceae bacterium]